VTITGNLGVNKTATLSVTQAALSTLRADRVVVPSGSSLLLTLTLTGKTPAAGGTATATTTNATALPVVASTPLTGGTTTPTVTLTAGTVTTPQNVTLGYTVGAVNRTVIVSVVPVLSSLMLQQPTVLVGNASTAVVTLASPAPAAAPP
jgi:hypothetical protein